jgi:hypothetical protein
MSVGFRRVAFRLLRAEASDFFQTVLDPFFDTLFRETVVNAATQAAVFSNLRRGASSAQALAPDGSERAIDAAASK